MFKNKVGRPSNDLLKKRAILRIVIVSLIVFSIILFCNFLQNSNTRKLKGEISDFEQCGEGCVGSGFAADIIYSKVVENYNELYSKSYDFENYSMTDEELSKVKEIVIEGFTHDSKVDLKGIEKLSDLNILSLKNQDAITNINETNASIKNLNLLSNTKLETLELMGFNLENIDLSNNNDLVNLILAYNKIESINISNLSKLENFEIQNNKLENIDLKENSLLKNINLDSNNISNIDISNNVLLEEFYFVGNKVDEIDFSKNTKLKKLNLRSCDLKKIDLKNNIDLELLYLGSNNLVSIDLSNNTKLNQLQMARNKFYTYDSLKEGDIIDISKDVILPNQFNVNYTINDDQIAKIEDGKIIILKKGSTAIRVIHEYKNSNNEVLDITINGVINSKSVLKSDKYDVNTIKNYVYVHIDDDATILEHVSMDDATLKLENNEIIAFDNGGNEIDRYKIIRISSDEYDLSKSEINIKEAFDIEKINVVNGSALYKDNYLIIEYEDTEVKKIKINIEDSSSTSTVESSYTTLDKINPATYDNVITYIVIGVVSLIIIILSLLFIFKKEKNN